MLDLDANSPQSSTGDVTLDAPSVEQTDDIANSSPAEGSNPDVDTASLVRDVVQENRVDADPASPAVDQEVDPTVPIQDEPDDENYSDVPFHKHPRFQHLLRRVRESENDASQYRNVQEFLDTNGLAAEEAADALIIAGLMKTNPVEAFQRLQPVLQRLLYAAGEVLPADLDNMVRAGQMTHEAALQVSRARASVESVKAYQSFERQRFEREQVAARERAVSDTVAQWEADRRAKDPNFEAKIEPLMREVAFLQRSEGVPRDPQSALSQLKRAYSAVSGVASAPAAAPRRPAVRPVMGGQSSGSGTPQPQSTLDVIRSMRGSA